MSSFDYIFDSNWIASKNLLAFSSGADSTALFFILFDLGVEFDIAIVDYGKRAQSKDEVAHARTLAQKYNKQIFVLHAKPISKNFENDARLVRYKFFEDLIDEHGYENLFLAHQLNDRVEWFMMQFSRGAGLNSILGFKQIESRKTTNHTNYTIIRPLSDITKEDLIKYCQEKGLKYFVDSTNYDLKYKRNYFRNTFVNQLITEFNSGIKRSLDYLERDQNELENQIEITQITQNIYRIPQIKSNIIMINTIDKIAKRLGYVMSSKNRDEILRCEFSCVVGGQIAIDKDEQNIYVCRHMDAKIKISKKEKEIFRLKKIPIKIRNTILHDAVLENFL